MLMLEEIVRRFGVGPTEAGLVRDRLATSNLDFSEAEWSEIDAVVKDICRDLDIRMRGDPSPVTTPIELLVEKTWDTHDRDFQVCEVLVPEQCALICMYGRMYHVTITEVS